MRLRSYQAGACKNVAASWARGVRRVLLVAPTGSGKTRMGQELVSIAAASGRRVLWLAHRDELITQARERLLSGLGGTAVGVIAAGYPEIDALVQVSSVQTLVARGQKPPARLVVLDEAHHYVADEWGKIAQSYSSAAILGLTATPERSDGRPLGDLFDCLIVAAQYSELIESGHLVSCKVFRPKGALSGLAKTPAKAYELHGEEGQAFCFSPTVKEAYAHAMEFMLAGVKAEVIEQDTPTEKRRELLAAFRSRELRVLCNVYTLTEGVDVPDASVCVLARGVGHVSPYLQMAGRVLRPAPGKTHGILLDLPGCSYEHDLPTIDREYSLTDGIRVASGAPALRVCLQCGLTFLSQPVCPGCGFEVRDEKRPIRIYNQELAEVYDGANTPPEAKQAELKRLLSLGKSLGFVIHEYQRLFGERPNLRAVMDDSARNADLAALLDEARRRGYSPGWAYHRHKARFG